MTIDTTVPGDPAQVRAAAEWLDPGLKGAADGSVDTTTFIPVGVRSHWYGESADEYVSILVKLTDAGREAADQAGNAAEKFRAYAGQLERMQGDFATHRENARGQGLPVTGMIIGRPVSLIAEVPLSRDDPDWDDWETFQDKVKLYNRIAEDVGSWWGELEVWVAENIDAFLTGLPAQSTAEKMVTGLREAGDFAANTFLDGTELQWKTDAKFLTDQARELRDGADDFVDGLRSGNPAVKAAAEAANPQGMRVRADDAADLAKQLTRAGKTLPLIGDGIDLWNLRSALENGDEPFSILVEMGGGAAGAALAGVGLAGLAAAGVVTLPVWGTAVVVGGAAVAAGAGAVWAYESWVPQETREAIDAGLGTAWDATTDFAEDAWENTGEVVGDVGHGIGKAWDGVKGIFG